MLQKICPFFILPLLIISQAHALDVEIMQNPQSVGINGSDLSVATTDLDPQMFAAADSYNRFAGRVIQMHENNRALNYRGWMHFGVWDKRTLKWDKNDKKSSFDVQHASIDINNHGCISELDGRSRKLHHRFKQHDGSATAAWKNGGLAGDVDFGNSTAINDDGIVIAVYKDKGKSDLRYSLGIIKQDCTAVVWHKRNIKYDTGQFPAVSISNENNGKTRLIEVHKGSGSTGKLYYNTGHIIRTDHGTLDIEWANPNAGNNNQTRGTIYNSGAAGQWPSVAMTKDGANVVTLNRRNSADGILELSTGRLYFDARGKLIVKDLNQRQTGIGSTNKAPSISITNEGYAVAVAQWHTINFLTLLTAQKLIKNTDPAWVGNSISIDSFENRPLEPNRFYQFGFRPLADPGECFNIRDGNKALLLTSINSNDKHRTFNAQADSNGQIQLIFGADCGTTAVSKLISTMTMNEVSPLDVIVNNTQATYSSQSVWQKFGDYYKATVSNLNPGSRFSLGFTVADNCAVLYDKDIAIYSAGSADKKDSYNIIDTISDIAGNILLVLDTGKCAAPKLNELISHIEIYENEPFIKIMPTADDWHLQQPGLYQSTIAGLNPGALYTLRLQHLNPCAAVYHHKERMFRFDTSAQHYLIDRFSNTDGMITLTLDTSACPVTMLDEIMGEISVFANPVVTTFNLGGDDQSVTVSGLQPYGVYLLHGIVVNEGEILKNGHGEILINRAENGRVYTLNQAADSAGKLTLSLYPPAYKSRNQSAKTISLYQPRATAVITQAEITDKLAMTGQYYARACAVDSQAMLYIDNSPLFSRQGSDAYCYTGNISLSNVNAPVFSTDGNIDLIAFYPQQALGAVSEIADIFMPAVAIEHNIAPGRFYHLGVAMRAAMPLTVNGGNESINLDKGFNSVDVVADKTGKLKLNFGTDNNHQSKDIALITLYSPLAQAVISAQDWHGDTPEAGKLGLSAAADYLLGFELQPGDPFRLSDTLSAGSLHRVFPADAAGYCLLAVKSGSAGALFLRAEGLTRAAERLGPIAIYKLAELSALRLPSQC